MPKERDALLHNIAGRHVTLKLVNEHRCLCEPLVVLEESPSSSRKWDGRSVISSKWALSEPAAEQDKQRAEETPRSDVPPPG